MSKGKNDRICACGCQQLIWLPYKDHWYKENRHRRSYYVSKHHIPLFRKYDLSDAERTEFIISMGYVDASKEGAQNE